MAIVPARSWAASKNSDAGNPQRSISFNVNGVSRLQNNTRLDRRQHHLSVAADQRGVRPVPWKPSRP